MKEIGFVSSGIAAFAFTGDFGAVFSADPNSLKLTNSARIGRRCARPA